MPTRGRCCNLLHRWRNEVRLIAARAGSSAIVAADRGRADRRGSSAAGAAALRGGTMSKPGRHHRGSMAASEWSAAGALRRQFHDNRGLMGQTQRLPSPHSVDRTV